MQLGGRASAYLLLFCLIENIYLKYVTCLRSELHEANLDNVPVTASGSCVAETVR